MAKENVMDVVESSTESREEGGKSKLQKEMEKVAYDTVDGSKCMAEITAIDERPYSGGNGCIRVRVMLPSGREVYEMYEKPELDSERYELVRLLNSAGCGLMNIDSAVGKKVMVEIDDNGPSIVIPAKEDPDGVEQMIEVLTGKLSEMAENRDIVGREPAFYLVYLLAFSVGFLMGGLVIIEIIEVVLSLL